MFWILESANSSLVKIARPPFLVGELCGLGEAGVSVVVQQLLPIHQLVRCLRRHTIMTSLI